MNDNDKLSEEEEARVGEAAAQAMSIIGRSSSDDILRIQALAAMFVRGCLHADFPPHLAMELMIKIWNGFIQDGELADGPEIEFHVVPINMDTEGEPN